MPRPAGVYDGLGRNGLRTIAKEMRRRMERCAMAQGMTLMSSGGERLPGEITMEQIKAINNIVAERFNLWYRSNIAELIDEIESKQK